MNIIKRVKNTVGAMQMTALVKGSVARGRAPLPPEEHMMKYARGGAVESFMVEVILSLFLRVRIDFQ